MCAWVVLERGYVCNDCVGEVLCVHGLCWRGAMCAMIALKDNVCKDCVEGLC